jgi:hypothetical protein
MIVRGIRISQWAMQKDIKKLVRQLFPGTSVHVRSCGWRKYEWRWEGNAAYSDMRTLADEVEAAVPVKAALTIECRQVEP